MIRTFGFLIFAFVTGQIVARVEAADDFSGTWINADPATNGVTKLVITQGEKTLMIHAWGKCRTQDCDWGETPLVLLGKDAAAREFPFGFATWDPKFKVTHMTLQLDRNEVVVLTYGIFKDGSGRSNYRSEYRFKRSAE